MGERRIRGRAFARVGDERGIALVMALVVMSFLTIATGALITLTTSNENAFSRDRQEARAFNIGEAGLNFGISNLTNLDPSGQVAILSQVGTNDCSNPNAQTYGIDGETGCWWAQKTGPGHWRVWARGISPNAKVTRTVSVVAQGAVTQTNIPPSGAWAYGFFVASPSGCTNMVGNSTLTLPVWIQADLCLNGSQFIAEPSLAGPQRVSLYVGGKLTLKGGASVGTASREILKATVRNGCWNGNKNPLCSEKAQSSVYASAYDNIASDLSKPPVFPDETYDSADWQNPVCSTGSFTFDNDGLRNSSLGSVSLMTPQSYDCVVQDSSGTPVAGLAWDKNAKLLRITNTVFIDGSLVFNGGDQGSYQGFGNIYVSGSVSTNGNSALCGPGATLAGSSCTGLWDGALGALTITTLNGGWKMNGNAEFNLAAYVVGEYDDGGSAKVTGPVITDRAKVHGTSDTTDLLNPPPGAPGAGGTSITTTWSTVKGSWNQNGS